MESARRSIEASVSRLAHFLSGVPSADVPNLSGWRPSATWDYALPNGQSKLPHFGSSLSRGGFGMGR